MTANQDIHDNFGLSPEEAQLYAPAIAALIDRHGEYKTLAIWAEHADGKCHAATLGNVALTDLVVADAAGSLSPAWGDATIQQFARLGGEETDSQVAMAGQGLAFLAGVQPSDTLQAVTGAQLYVLHLLAMKLAPAALNGDGSAAIDRLIDVLKLTSGALDALLQLKGAAHG